MKKITLVLALLLIFVVSGCVLRGVNKTTKESKNNDQFNNLLSQTFSSKLSLEEGYGIAIPYVKKWAGDSVLTRYHTNMPTTKFNYMVNTYCFDSLSQKKTLCIGYNYDISSGELSSPSLFRTNNKFTIKEMDWTNEPDWEELSIQQIIDAKEAYSKKRLNNLNQFVTSKKIFELANTEGLNVFINQYSNLDIKNNSIILMEFDNGDVEWQVLYAVGEQNSIKSIHTFIAKFDPVSGKLINKSIK